MKKLCINTFFHVAQHRPKTKPCINTVFLSVDAVLHGKNNVYTRFFRWEIKLCLYIVFSAPPEMRHCSSLRAPFLMYSLLFPHVTAVAVLCVRIAGGCSTTWRPKPKSNTNKKTVFKHIFHTTPKTQYPLSCRRQKQSFAFEGCFGNVSGMCRWCFWDIPKVF